MANINLTPGERYTFGKLKGISVITDSTDNAETPKYIRNTLYVTASNSELNVAGVNALVKVSTTSVNDPMLQFSIGSLQAENWTMGIDNTDGGSFKLNNRQVLSTDSTLALRIDTDENIWIPGNVTITGSFALGGIANTVTANALYYNTTTKQVTYGLASGSGGTGTPGGSDTQIQYNNAGAFGGVSNLTWNGTTLRATGSFTGSFRGNLIGSASVATSASFAVSASWAPGSGGSGTVNSGVANYLAYYDSTAASISDINTSGAGVKTNSVVYDGSIYGWGLMLVASNGATGSHISAGVLGQDTWFNVLGGTVGIAKSSSFASGAVLDVSGSVVVTGSIRATSGFIGSLTGTASISTKTNTNYITDNTAFNSTYYPTFVQSGGDYYNLQIDSSVFSYNPSTNILTTTSSYALTASYMSGSISNAISSSYALTASLAPLYLPLAGGSLTGNVSATGRTFTFQDLVLGSGTTFGTIKTDGTKYIGIYPTNGTESSRFLANGNVIHGTTFTDLGYRLQVSASTAPSGALYVVGTSLFSGSLTVGNVTSTPSTEATLNVYPPMTSGTGEGGQILLAASGGLYTSASMLDNWQNYFRILKGTNTGGSTNQLIGLDLHTGNLSVAGAIIPSAWSAGQVIKDTMLSNSEVTISTTTIATSTSDTDFLTYSYTPVSSNSYLIIHYHLSNYDFSGGTGNDSYISRIKVDGNEITYSTQSTVNGNRAGVLFPLTGRYTNSNTTAKSIVVACRRNSADDSITITNAATSMWLRITEIGR
jgi:hypothetical protein